MASNNDGPNKGSMKPGADSGSKKPSALIDLKATEINIRDPKQDAVKSPGPSAKDQPGSGMGQAASAVAGAAAAAATVAAVSAGSAATGAGKAGAPAGAGAQAGGGTATASAAVKPAAGQQPATAGPAASSASAATAPPRIVASGGGLKGAATHLAAGLAGGLLALIGADALLPASRPATMADTSAVKALEARLANVEVVSARQTAPDVVQRLAASEQKLAQIERLAADLKDQQAGQQAEAKQAGERLAQQVAQGNSGSADAEKFAKLEDMLNTLTAAAATDPQRGRIPQLAGITGKLSDLETSLATQLAALRKSVTQEVDSRLAQSNDAAQAARTGTQRLDRELAGVKTEAAQILQRVDGLKSQSDRAEIALKGLRDDTGGLKSEVAAVRDGITRELQQVARPTDVSSAISPLTTKLSALEQNVQGVVRGEDDRRANVERIVMALELGNLKRTVERGAPFVNELAEVRRIAGTKIDLSALDRFKEKGVATAGDLEREFRTLAFRVIDADAQPLDANWSDRLIASAKSVVRVRKVDQGADDKSAEATVARMDLALKAGKLGDVVSEAGKLPDRAKAPALGWLEKVNARAAVEGAITAIEQELKASLGAQSQAGKKG